jgi:hypothetical protein
MNSKNFQIGHQADIAAEWLPKIVPPTPPKASILTKKSEEKGEEKSEEKDTKIKGHQAFCLIL